MQKILIQINSQFSCMKKNIFFFFKKEPTPYKNKVNCAEYVLDIQPVL
jgi:hypothetical protein